MNRLPGKKDQGQDGFTLVEMLVVCVLLALMASILYGTINGILTSKSLVERQREVDREAQFLLDRITRELISKAPISLSTDSTAGNEKDQQADKQQTNLMMTPRSFVEGIHKQNGEADSDTIRFVSNGSGEALLGWIANAGVIEIRYSLQEPEDRQSERPKDGLESMVLVREELPADVKNKDLLKKRHISVPLASDVVSLTFRYLKEGKWQDEWKSEYARLPEAVEITLGIRGANDEVQIFRTAVAVSPIAKKNKQSTGSSTYPYGG